MKTIFLDVDTQLDFLYPAGALYVPGAERVVDRVAQLNRHAAAQSIPLISTVDAHAENDPEFSSWPPHCVAGTLGQNKAAQTLVDGRVVIPNRECDLAVEGARQIIVEKQTVEPLAALNLPRLITRLGATRFVVYGVVTEVCVWYAVRDLLKLGGKVIVVTDAIQPLTPEAGKRSLEEMRSAGAMMAPASEILLAG